MFLSKFFHKEETKNKKNETPKKKESKATPPNLSFKEFSAMMKSGEKFVLK